MNAQQETAWLAGILEGEGSFRVQRDRRHPNCRPKLEVSVSMTDRDVVDRLIEMVPTTRKILEENANSRPSAIKLRESYGGTKTWKISWKATWGGMTAENLMRRVLPYMGERRKAKITEILAMDLSHHTKLKEGEAA